MKHRRILESFICAINGILYCFKTQRNFRIHCIATLSVLILSIIYDFSHIETLILIFTIVFVIITEMINTALEKSVDIIIDSYHPLAKIAKDIAAGAVLISSMNAVIVAYFLFVKNGRTSRVLSDVFQTLRELSPYLFVIILLIITLFIVIAKLIINKRYK